VGEKREGGEEERERDTRSACTRGSERKGARGRGREGVRGREG